MNPSCSFFNNLIAIPPGHLTISYYLTSSQLSTVIQFKNSIMDPSSKFHLLSSNLLPRYIKILKKSKYPILSATLQPHHGYPIGLPACIFEYWVEIGCAVDTQKQWKAALTWVQKYSVLPSARELHYNLLASLSSFSWSQDAAYTCDITSLLSNTPGEAYLSSFHINHMIAQSKTQYEAQLGPDHTSRCIFITVDLLGAITHFYGAACVKKEGHLWNTLMVIENRIITEEIDSLGGVMHLPLHWVSMIIDFQQSQILYGDSLGQKMPKHKHCAYEHWIGHLITQSSRAPT